MRGGTRAACAVLALAAATGAAPQSLPAVLAKHARSLGKKEIWKRGDYAIFGRVERGDERFVWRVFVRRKPFAFREEWIPVERKSASFVVSDGRYAWQAVPLLFAGQGRRAKPLPQSRARGTLNTAFLMGFGYLDRRRTRGSSGYDGRVDLEERPGLPSELARPRGVEALHFLSPAATLFRLGFDPDSGELLEVAEPELTKRFVRYGAYRDFDGVRLASLRVAGREGEPRRTVLRVDRVLTGIVHPAWYFEGCPVVEPEGPQLGGNLRLAAGGVPGSARLLLAGVKLGRAPPRVAICDTGADMAALDPGLATALKLPVAGRYAMRTLHGLLGGRYTWLDRLQLGEHVDLQLMARVTRLPAISELPVDRPSGLLLGLRELTPRVPSLDLRGGKLVFGAGPTEREEGSQPHLELHPLRPPRKTFAVELSFGKRKARAFFDTGFPQLLRLTRAGLARLGLPTGAAHWRARGALATPTVGVGGGPVRAEFIARLPGKLRVGPLVFERPLVQLAPEDPTRGAREVILGCGFLLVLDRMSIDLPRRRLWLEPTGVAADGSWHVPESPRWSGLLVQQGRTAPVRAADAMPGVFFVSPKSPAAEAGVRVGDRLVSVAGRPCVGRPLEAVHRALGLARGAELELALLGHDGKTRRVLLR